MWGLGWKRILRPLFLAVALCLVLPAAGWAATIVVGGTGAALGAIRLLARAYERDNPGVEIDILASLGSSGGILAVSSGAVDIGLSSRPLKDAEVGVGLSATVYAKSPFVFVTSSLTANPNLTRSELVTIYSGALVFWPDGARIRPVLRPEADGDSTLLTGFVEGMEAALAAARAIPGVPVATTDQDAMEAAEKMLGALTTATLTAIVAERRDLVPVSVDGVAPTLENLANGSYAMSKTLYIVTSRDLSAAANDFVRFVRSPAGAEILARAGSLSSSSAK